ncbi:tetratricopeptide repeat protein [candidate division KSB1 bacterium]
MKKKTLKSFIFYFCKDPMPDKKFCFILGAGASKSSGIPTGADLVKIWLKDLAEKLEPKELEEWKKTESISENDPASNYSEIYRKRFEDRKEDGYGYLDKIMDGIEPSCGYSILAKILADGKHKIVITTNFDSLTEDALFIYTQKKPLVIGHEALADYIKPDAITRPIVVKIHRDVLLYPMNREDETSSIDIKYAEILPAIFKAYTPLVIGYGGNDGSLMGLLDDLEEIKDSIFWFYREQDGELDNGIKKLIKKHNGFAVPIPGFDELMIQIGDKLGLKPLGTEIVKVAEKRAKKYREQIVKVNEEIEKDKDTKEALVSIVSRGEKNWWYYEMQASSEVDLEKRDKIYLEGIEKYPESAELIGNYALFLKDDLKDYDKAEEYYLEALELDPDDADFNGNYANFLFDVRKDYDKAEEYYLEALDIDPDDAYFHGNYAKYLIVNKEYETAEQYINKAFELNEGENQGLDLELWFYRYAVFFEKYKDAGKKVGELLDTGVSSPGWYLDDVVERAKELGHPDIKKLKQLAKKISPVD